MSDTLKPGEQNSQQTVNNIIDHIYDKGFDPAKLAEATEAVRRMNNILGFQSMVGGLIVPTEIAEAAKKLGAAAAATAAQSDDDLWLDPGPRFDGIHAPLLPLDAGVPSDAPQVDTDSGTYYINNREKIVDGTKTIFSDSFSAESILPDTWTSSTPLRPGQIVELVSQGCTCGHHTKHTNPHECMSPEHYQTVRFFRMAWIRIKDTHRRISGFIPWNEINRLKTEIQIANQMYRMAGNERRWVEDIANRQRDFLAFALGLLAAAPLEDAPRTLQEAMPKVFQRNLPFIFVHPDTIFEWHKVDWFLGTAIPSIISTPYVPKGKMVVGDESLHRLYMKAEGLL